MDKKDSFLKNLILYNGISVFAYGLIGPLYALFAQKFATDTFQISLSWAVFLIATSISLYFVSKLGDKVKDKKNLLLARCLIRAFVWVSFVFINDFWLLVLLQAILGIGESLGAPSFEALFAEHLSKGKHVRSYAQWNLVVNIMTGLATIAGGLLVDRFGFSLLFITMAAISMLSFIGLMFMPRITHTLPFVEIEKNK